MYLTSRRTSRTMLIFFRLVQAIFAHFQEAHLLFCVKEVVFTEKNYVKKIQDHVTVALVITCNK